MLFRPTRDRTQAIELYAAFPALLVPSIDSFFLASFFRFVVSLGLVINLFRNAELFFHHLV